MARTPSSMLALGTPCPPFSLIDVRSGRNVTSEQLLAGADGLLVMFICNHCPFVVHVLPALDRLEAQFADTGLRIVAINANDTTAYPQDGPGPMADLADERGWGFPFLLDDTQEVAKAFAAACTPDFFLFGKEGTLTYRGQLDDSRPGNGVAVTGGDLIAAISATLRGEAPNPEQKPSLGCNIKWRDAGK